MIICKKHGQPIRRRGFMAVCLPKHAARLQYDFTEACMTHDEPDSTAASALAVMERHLHALNGLRENDLADTLHFPHFRLAGTTLDCWPSAETYLSDFRARAGDDWARTAWQAIDVQRESADKVHLAVRTNRFDINDQLIADFDTVWAITLKNGK